MSGRFVSLFLVVFLLIYNLDVLFDDSLLSSNFVAEDVVFLADNLPQPTYDTKGSRDAIVRLYRDDLFFCSGTVISDQYILTAAHCFLNKQKIDFTKIIVKDSKESIEVYGKLAGLYGVQDVALLVGDFKDFKSYKARFKDLNFLQYSKKGVTCGYPHGQTDIFCSEFSYSSNSDFLIKGEGLMYRGCSGGPLLVDGEVVGVNSAVSGESVIIGPLVGIDAAFDLRF